MSKARKIELARPVFPVNESKICVDEAVHVASGQTCIFPCLLSSWSRKHPWVFCVFVSCTITHHVQPKAQAVISAEYANHIILLFKRRPDSHCTCHGDVLCRM